MGGTFNPIHLGHLRAAEEIAEHFRLNQVCFMPAARPPHKSPEPLVDYAHRLEMLKLAVADRPGFKVSDLESRLPYPSYTLNTVKAFQEETGRSGEIFFLVGLDSFMTVSQWHRWPELLAATAFIVFARAGMPEPFEAMRDMLKTIDPETTWDGREECFKIAEARPLYFLPGGRLIISSTDLRQRLESGESVRYLIPEPVRRYIEIHSLYRPA